MFQKKQFLKSIEEIVSNELDLENLLERLCKSFLANLEIAHSGIFLVDIELGKIRLAHIEGVRPSLKILKQRLNLDYDQKNGILIKTILKGSPKYYFLKEEKEKFYKFYSESTGTKTQLIIPLIIGSKSKTPIGCILLDYTEHDPKKVSRDKKWMESAISLIAKGIRNSILLDKSNVQSDYFQKLHLAALTLNKLYLGNQNEMMRMLLLTLSGFVDSKKYLLIQKDLTTKISECYQMEKEFQHFHFSKGPIPYNPVIREDYYLENQEVDELNFSEEYLPTLYIPIYSSKLFYYEFVIQKNGLRFKKEEIDVLVAFGSLARITLENLDLYESTIQKSKLEQEITIASEIQRNLLPKNTIFNDSIALRGKMVPARGIGGDYYDFIANPQNVDHFIVIGDVSGKGIPAGIVMATVRTILHSLVRRAKDPWEILTEINTYIHYNYNEPGNLRFMSMILFCYDSQNNSFVFSGAGHGDIYIFRKKRKEIETISSRGIILGVKNSIEEFQNRYEVNLEKGDVILLTTDGVVEAISLKGEAFGEDRLKEELLSCCLQSQGDVLEPILNSLNSFSKGREQHDDITMVSIEAL